MCDEQRKPAWAVFPDVLLEAGSFLLGQGGGQETSDSHVGPFFFFLPDAEIPGMWLPECLVCVSAALPTALCRRTRMTRGRDKAEIFLDRDCHYRRRCSVLGRRCRAGIILKTRRTCQKR